MYHIFLSFISNSSSELSRSLINNTFEQNGVVLSKNDFFSKVVLL